MSEAFQETALAPRLRFGQWLLALPDFPGRDTLLRGLLRPVYELDVPVRGTFGGGLRFEGNPATDDNVVEMVKQRFSRPALAAVFDAALEAGGVLADVGANHGLYALWGARRVGPDGEVHAFEPNPEVRARLERNASLNGFGQIRIVAEAVGSEPGEITLYRMAKASGRTSRYLEDHAVADSVSVPVTTLDVYFEGRKAPSLMKIDVEGMEYQVLAGATRMLSGADAPAIVFEAEPAQLEVAGTSYRDVTGLLAASGGYRIWALRPEGLRPEPEDAAQPGSFNVLALRDDLPLHGVLRERLRRVRFPANQNA